MESIRNYRANLMNAVSMLAIALAFGFIDWLADTDRLLGGILAFGALALVNLILYMRGTRTIAHARIKERNTPT